MTRERRAPGALIGDKYRVVRALGEGSHGTVYEAENTWTGRRVAVKLLRAELGGDAEVVRRFQQEARASVRVAHPNVVDALDMGEDPEDGALYLVQPLLEGGDLRALLKAEGRLDVARSLDILVPVLGALAAAHARGVVHRDVKPENVFLARAGATVVPTLIDFGVAKVVESAGPHTRTGTRIGTPRYMAPEQVRGERDVDPRADVWAAGAVLHEMLAGRPAFEGDDAVDVMQRIVEGRAPRVEAHAPDVPRALGDIVRRALEPDRARRYASAGEFLDAIVACREVDGASLAERHKGSIPERAAPVTAPARAPGRARTAWIGAALALWAIGAALGWWLQGAAAR